MQPTSDTLAARLRRRSATMAWLFVVLMLGKIFIATACLSDGVSTVDAGTVAVVSPVDSDDLLVVAAFKADAQDDCWHAGSNGCHCACVHVTAIPPALWFMAAAPLDSAHFGRHAAPVPDNLRDDHLRPPIA